MKKVLLIILMFTTLLSCEKDEVSLYRNLRHIYFDYENNFVKEYSFALNPGKSSDSIAIEVTYTGILLDIDKEFKIIVNRDSTTASDGDYEILGNNVFSKEKIVDTVYVKIYNSEKLKTEKLQLCLTLVENDNFLATMRNSLNMKIIFSDMISKPYWWNEDVVDYYLGEYSDKKIGYFISVTGVNDFGNLSSSEKRAYALKFKYYLSSEAAKGEAYVIKEEDGSVMEVSVIG